MKKIIFLMLFVYSFSTFAEKLCRDSNLNGLEGGESYDKLQYHSRFELLFNGDSPAPAGFSKYFGPDNELCYDVAATYLKHISTGKIYLMYSTHDDYCDGGNTLGIMIDMEIYTQGKREEAIVGDIGDSEFYCR